MDLPESLVRAIEKFKGDLNKNPRFLEAKKILERTAIGRVWMIGGGVYRPISAELHNLYIQNSDMDFIVEKAATNYKLPAGWSEGRNRHENPKFFNPLSRQSIDLVPIETTHSIIKRGLEPTIENYLSGVPLTVQSVAYDLERMDVIGEVGLKAILTKMVAINNQDEAKYGSLKKGMDLKSYLEKTARELGFKAII